MVRSLPRATLGESQNLACKSKEYLNVSRELSKDLAAIGIIKLAVVVTNAVACSKISFYLSVLL